MLYRGGVNATGLVSLRSANSVRVTTDRLEAALRAMRLPSSRASTTPPLKPGAGVVTTRGHVHYVVTEYGVVNLHGLSLRQRAEALISIAHPDVRDELRRETNALRHWTL